MKNQQPLVSVIMNCHNGEKYLREAIDSVISQTYNNWELILWDNHSTDKTSDIIKSYTDSRVHYHYSDTFTTLGQARNSAIDVSNGEIIAFLDADDIWFKEKLIKQIPLFRDKDIGIVICDSYSFNEKNLERQLYKKNKPKVGKVFRELLGSYYISMETAVVRRAALDSLDHIFDEKFNMIEEYDLFVRLSYNWSLGYVDEVLAKWRVHSSSWTWSHSDLFPKERKLLLVKLRKYIRNFDDIYAEEIILIKQTIALEEAQDKWKNGNNKEARKILEEYKHSGFKWLVAYYLTWLPYLLFINIRRLKGNLIP